MDAEELSFEDRSASAELWEEVGLSRPWNDPLADFDRALNGPTSTVLGVRRDGALVGTVMVGHDGHRGWVYYLAVSVAHQQRGLGTVLMAAAEEWLRRVGAVKVQLMVRHTNGRAIGFYESLGYEDAGVTVLSHWLQTSPP